MVSFGDSKHEPVKPLQSLLNVTTLKLALSAKCTIHDVRASTSYFNQQVVLSILDTKNLNFNHWQCK